MIHSGPFFCLFKSSPEGILLILERREGRERNINVRENHQSAASSPHPVQGLNPRPSMFPDQNRTHDLPVYRLMLQLMRPHQPGHNQVFLKNLHILLIFFWKLHTCTVFGEDTREIGHSAVVIKIGSVIGKGLGKGTMEVGWICILEIQRKSFQMCWGEEL